MTTEKAPLDPESFRGKLYLLILDKIVIGALIAIAFVVYDRWRTRELRNYEEETQFAFKRAEYVKELVPIVLDDKQDVLYRAHSLGALVETKSIDTTSAVTLAKKLLDANVLGLGEFKTTWTNPVNQEVHTVIYPSATAGDYFGTTMLKTMPAGLPALLDEFRADLIKVTGTDRGHNFRYLNPPGHFWMALFWQTIKKYPDSELTLLDSDDFLSANIYTLDSIIPEFLRRADAEQLAKRDLKGLRILGSIRLLRLSREGDAYAVVQLQSAIDPPTHDQMTLKVSAETIELLPPDYPVCVSLSGRLLDIALRREDFAFHRKDLGDEPSPMEERFRAASEYLVSCAENPKVADELEPTILPIVRDFYERLKRTPGGFTGSELGYPEGEMFRLNYPIEWTLVRFLMRAEVAPNRPAGSEADRLLSDMFSLPEDKLVQGGIHHFAEEWKNARVGKTPVGRP